MLGVAGLEIRFAVEVDGLEVGDAGGIAGGEEDHVTGDGVVGGDLDDFADAEVFPAFVDEGEVVKGESEAGVLDAVGTVAAEVLVGVFDGGDEKDKGERENGGAAAEDSELRELVEDGDGKEVEVGNAVELLEEIAREEGQNGVLAGADRVAGEVQPLVRLLRVVDEDEASVIVGDLFLGSARPVGLRAGAVADGGGGLRGSRIDGEGDVVSGGTRTGRAPGGRKPKRRRHRGGRLGGGRRSGRRV